MGTEEAAITMVNYYTTVTPHVRNVPVFIQYSNHKELKTDAGNQVSRLWLLDPCVLDEYAGFLFNKHHNSSFIYLGCFQLQKSLYRICTES